MTRKLLVEIPNKRKVFKTETYYLDFEIRIAYGLGIFVVEMLGWNEEDELPEFYFNSPFCSGLEEMIEEIIKNIRSSKTSMAVQEKAIDSFARALMEFRIKHHP